MEIAEYFDSVASFWDDDFSEAKPARVVASTISIPRGGACVLYTKKLFLCISRYRFFEQLPI